HKPLTEALSGVLREGREAEEGDTEDDPGGLELLGDDGPSKSNDELAALLKVVVAVKDAPDGDEVELPGGVTVSPTAVQDKIRSGVDKALKARRRAAAAGDRIFRPANELRQANSSLEAALDAIEAVSDDPAFAGQASEVADQVEQARDLLD